MFSKILNLVGIIIVILGFSLVAANAAPQSVVGPAPRSCTPSGPIKTVSVPKGSLVWGFVVDGWSKQNALILVTNAPTTVTVRHGCVEQVPNTNLLGRKNYLEKTYASTKFTCYVNKVEDANCDGVIPTVTPTKGTSTPTATRTVTVTGTPPTATPSRTVVATPTPIVTLRSDMIVSGTKSVKPQAGQVWWCKEYNGVKNTIRTIRTSHFYGLSVSECGAQTKPPFNSLGAIEVYLEKTTGQPWSVVR